MPYHCGQRVIQIVGVPVIKCDGYGARRKAPFPQSIDKFYQRKRIGMCTQHRHMLSEKSW